MAEKQPLKITDKRRYAKGAPKLRRGIRNPMDEAERELGMGSGELAGTFPIQFQRYLRGGAPQGGEY